MQEEKFTRIKNGPEDIFQVFLEMIVTDRVQQTLSFFGRRQASQAADVYRVENLGGPFSRSQHARDYLSFDDFLVNRIAIEQVQGLGEGWGRIRLAGEADARLARPKVLRK